MGWQISFLLGFFLLFSICISLPSDDQYVTNSFGIKHYVLTPEILDASSSGDDLTNVLFTKYEDPWEVKSIFIIGYLTLLFVSLYLLLTIYHTRSTVFSKLKIKNSYFSNKKLLLDFSTDNVPNNLKQFKIIVVHSKHSKTFTKYLTFSFSKKFKLKKLNKKISFFIFVFLLSSTFYISPAFAVDVPDTITLVASASGSANGATTASLQIDTTGAGDARKLVVLVMVSSSWISF